MEAACSFASRRPATNDLPHFHLPPPNSAADQIPRITEGLSPLSPSVNSGSSSQTNLAQYNTPSSSWQMPNSQSYTYGSMSQSQGGLMPGANFPRNVYSTPNTSYNPRNSQSPAGMQPPYDQLSPPFPTLPSLGSTGSPMAPQGSQQPSMQGPILSSQPPASQPPTPSRTTTESYARAPSYSPYGASPLSTPRAPTYPNYVTSPPQSTPQPPTSYSNYATQPSPPQSSPTAAATLRNMSAPSPHYRQSYYLPMTGSVMSQMTSPGGLALVGGMGSMGPGFAGQPLGQPPMYPHPNQERPFKCDQCTQSFNRNHDLKRHKRIHLAVKPFPCNWCDKSFSRKDALKRHRLVKGCGKDEDSPPPPGSIPTPKSEMKSEAQRRSESPTRDRQRNP